MRIAIDASHALLSNGPTGVERYTDALLSALKRIREPNTFITLYTDHDLAGVLGPFDERWQQRILPRTFFTAYGGWTHTILRNAVVKDVPDVFFVPSSVLPVGMGLYPKPKLITTIHDVGFLDAPHVYPRRELLYQRWGFNNAIRNTSQLIVHAEVTRNTLYGYTDYPKERIHVIPLAVDVSQFPARAPKLPITPRILYIGRIEAKKNLTTLLTAFDQIRKHRPHATLVCIGKQGFRGGAIVQQIKNTPGVRYYPWCKDHVLRQHWENASVLVMPCPWEGFGLPALEAFAIGVPIVAANAGALLEVIGDAGLFFAPFNAHECAKKIMNILDNPALTQTLIRRGQQRVRRYRWDATARATLAVLVHA